MNNLRLVLGGPGCGKTTALLNILEDELHKGCSPKEIAYVSYTRAAADDAKDRAAKRFGFDVDSDMPYFRTIHSLAFREMAMTRDEVMGPDDWREFSNLVGQAVTGRSEGTERDGSGGADGDQLLRITDYAATTLQPLETVFHELGEPVDWFTLVRFAKTLEKYKETVGKVEFTDMLLQYAAKQQPLPVKIAVIDEAQDLTAAQWAVVRMAFANAERVYIGGDDDQAIYKWSGADVETFLHLSGTPTVLSVSHRLPRAIHSYAQSIVQRISTRYQKPYAPSDREGSVNFYWDARNIDLLMPGTWFLLARNRYTLKGLESHVQRYGINYTMYDTPAIKPDDVRVIYSWDKLLKKKIPHLTTKEARALYKALDMPVPPMAEHDTHTLESMNVRTRAEWFDALVGIPQWRRDFYASCLRRGEKLTTPPRIHLRTIHGVKGAEADHVVLLSDISGRTKKGFLAAPDHEHRVFYVGVTRAKESLHIIMPRTQNFYPLRVED